MGVDVSKSMLREAKRKIKKLRLEDKIELILADMKNIPLVNDSVDAVICAFACHYFPHPLETTREISRVLKSNKRIVVVDACQPESPFKRLISDLYAKITDRSWRSGSTQKGNSSGRADFETYTATASIRPTTSSLQA